MGQSRDLRALTNRSVWEHQPDRVYHSDLQRFEIDADKAHWLYYRTVIP